MYRAIHAKLSIRVVCLRRTMVCRTLGIGSRIDSASAPSVRRWDRGELLGFLSMVTHFDAFAVPQVRALLLQELELAPSEWERGSVVANTVCVRRLGDDTNGFNAAFTVDPPPGGWLLDRNYRVELVVDNAVNDDDDDEVEPYRGREWAAGEEGEGLNGFDGRAYHFRTEHLGIGVPFALGEQGDLVGTVGFVS